MIEYVEKGLKNDYRFMLNLEGIVVSVKKNLPLCSFKELYSSSYADCDNIKVKCGLLSNTMTIDYEDISFSHGKDAKKILYLIRLGQVDLARLEHFIDDNVTTKSLDDIDISDLEPLFDSYSRKKGILDELEYTPPKQRPKSKKKENQQASEKVPVNRNSPTDKTIIEDGVLMLEDSIKSIDSENLDYRGVDVIVLPRDLEELDDTAFENCQNVKEIDFCKVSRLKTIHEQVFCNLDRITSITLPEGVTEVEYLAFNNCRKLRKIVFPSTIKKISGGFATDCPKLCDVDLSRVYKMETLDAEFLEEDNKVKTLIIPEGVKDVGDHIVGSGVKTLYIPSTVKKVGCPCEGTDNLTVYLYTTADDLISIVDLCEDDIKLRVRESVFDIYKKFIENEIDDEITIDLGSFPDDAPYVSEDYERESGYRKAQQRRIDKDKAKEKSEKTKETEDKTFSTLKVFIVADGKQEGPYDEEQFARLVEYGLVNSDTLVWQEGMAQWQKAGSVEELQHFFNTNKGGSTPPPVPMS